MKLYKKSLDHSNIIYGIAEIKKSGYKELDMFVPYIGGLSAILETMIFVHNNNEGMTLTEYLRTKLPDNLKNKAD